MDGMDISAEKAPAGFKKENFFKKKNERENKNKKGDNLMGFGEELRGLQSL